MEKENQATVGISNEELLFTAVAACPT